MLLEVIVFAWKEAPTIERLIRAIPRQMKGADRVRVVVVDDGSTNRTADIARTARAVVISHGRDRGLGTAFRTGLSDALGPAILLALFGLQACVMHRNQFLLV